MVSQVTSLLRRIRDHNYYSTYKIFKQDTMVQPSKYVANLKLSASRCDVAGAVVECGTWKGGMIAGIARTLGNDRTYHLFDSFEGLPDVEPIDGTQAKKWQETPSAPRFYDNCTASERDAEKAMKRTEVSNYHITKGWFEDTLSEASFPQGISILRMDADWYRSTMQILESLFPLVVDHGLILVDDYYTWEGCSKAVHDYLSQNDRPERISNYQGVCFIEKIKTST